MSYDNQTAVITNYTSNIIGLGILDTFVDDIIKAANNSEIAKDVNEYSLLYVE